MNDKQVTEVIKRFYEKAIDDIMIGFHFRHIEDFSTHIPRISLFWQKQLLDQAITLTPPVELIKAHYYLKINKGQVNAWIKIFNENLDEFARKWPEEKAIFDRWKKLVSNYQQIFLKSSKLYSHET